MIRSLSLRSAVIYIIYMSQATQPVSASWFAAPPEAREEAAKGRGQPGQPGQPGKPGKPGQGPWNCGSPGWWFQDISSPLQLIPI